MAIEIEVKVLEVDPVDVARRLEALGAQRAGAGRLATAIYDHPDRRLLARGAYARVRRFGAGSVEVGYKGGAAGPAGYKSREEIEFEAADFDLACAFLEAIGLTRVSYLEKDRTIWRWGAVEFCLDEWPHLPPYLEVEAPSAAEVDRGLEALGIPPERANTMGPVELFRHYGFELDEMPEVRFSQER